MTFGKLTYPNMPVNCEALDTQKVFKLEKFLTKKCHLSPTKLLVSRYI